MTRCMRVCWQVPWPVCLHVELQSPVGPASACPGYQAPAQMLQQVTCSCASCSSAIFILHMLHVLLVCSCGCEASDSFDSFAFLKRPVFILVPSSLPMAAAEHLTYALQLFKRGCPRREPTP